MPLLSASINEVEEAAVAMREALECSLEAMERLAQWREGGGSLLEFVDIFMSNRKKEQRLRASEATARFEHAMMLFRAHVVRSLVDDERMSLTGVGHHMGISRQMASRLYRAASEQPPLGAGRL